MLRHLVVLTLVLGGCAVPGVHPSRAFSYDDGLEGEEDERSALAVTLLYIPNRVLDVLDIVRARVRVGPGLAFGARATELADVFVGSYMTVFAGLPGPRNGKIPRLPAGLETKTGAEVSAVDVTLEGPIGPDYGPAEFGVSLQFFIVGFDVGLDPAELLDFLAGLLTFDPKQDDF